MTSAHVETVSYAALRTESPTIFFDDVAGPADLEARDLNKKLEGYRTEVIPSRKLAYPGFKGSW